LRMHKAHRSTLCCLSHGCVILVRWSHWSRGGILGVVLRCHLRPLTDK
jgi:hypothetical protein